MPKNPKIAAIIQARMTSNRLPGKVLLPLPFPNGRPILGHIIDQLRKSDQITDIIVAMTSNQEDDPMADFLEKEKVEYFRGDEKNVFSRFYEICHRYQPDHFVRITGDNPILDHHLLHEIVAYHVSHNNHYTISEGLPNGITFEVVSGNSFRQIDPDVLDAYQIEHVTPYFRFNDTLRSEYAFNLPTAIAKLRLTVDYPVDFGMFSILHGMMEHTEGLHPMEKIQKIYQDHPWIFQINQHMFQKRKFEHFGDELNEATKILRAIDMHQSAAILDQHLHTQKEPIEHS